MAKSEFYVGKPKKNHATWTHENEHLTYRRTVALENLQARMLLSDDELYATAKRFRDVDNDKESGAKLMVKYRKFMKDQETKLQSLV